MLLTAVTNVVIRFGEHEGSYCSVASFEKETDSKATTNTMESLRVITDHDNSGLIHNHHQNSPTRRLSRGKLLSPQHLSSTSPTGRPTRVQLQHQHLHHHHHQQQQLRLNPALNCFYPNYETTAHSAKGWFPVTQASSFGALSPSLAMGSYHTPKARAYAGWRLAYVPTVRYLANNMGQMLKV